MGPGKAPPAIKHFFDFLDAQAARMKITDPEVLHIWKTNRCVLLFIGSLAAVKTEPRATASLPPTNDYWNAA